MTWQWQIDRARRNGSIMVDKDTVEPIPPSFDEAPLTVPGLFGVFTRTTGVETIRITELPTHYQVTVNNPVRGSQPGLVDPTTQHPQSNPLDGDGLRRLAIAGLVGLGAVAVGKSLIGSRSEAEQTHRVFISHSWAYDEHFQDVRTLLDDARGFEWHDYSVPEEEKIDAQLPNHLRKKLRDQIRPTSVVLVLGGVYTSHSTWMQEEIEIANAMGKPILGVIPPGNDQVSSFVRKHAEELVDFDGDDILDAIQRLGT